MHAQVQPSIIVEANNLCPKSPATFLQSSSELQPAILLPHTAEQVSMALMSLFCRRLPDASGSFPVSRSFTKLKFARPCLKARPRREHHRISPCATTALGTLPKLNYLPIRGRGWLNLACCLWLSGGPEHVPSAGEPIRLALAALELDWEEVHWGRWANTDQDGKPRLINIDWQPEIKQDTHLFEFFQAPR